MEITKIPFGYIKENDIFLEGEKKDDSRKIGEVKDDDIEASVQYFVDKFDKLKEKVDALEEKINSSDNKGSFLMKLLHMKDSLNDHSGLGDYGSLRSRLESLEEVLKEVIEKNRERNTEIKNSLMAELEEALKNSNWREAQELIIDIRTRWIKTGSVKEDLKEEMETTFHEKVEDFFERKRSYEEDKKMLIYNRVGKYRDIIREARYLARSGDRNAKSKIKELQDKWRDVGNVPRIKYAPLQSDFKRACNDIFRGGGGGGRPQQRQRIVRTIPNYQLNENFEKKSRLLERARLLKQDPSLDKAKELKDKWKDIGPIPKEKFQPLTNDFFDAISFVHEVVYLDTLAEENNEGWGSLNILEQIKIKVKLLGDLIARDERELETISENTEQFSRGSGQFDKIAHEKLQTQQRKVRVKKEILSILKEIG